MAAVARAAVRVGQDAPLRRHAFVGRSGDPVGWLGVGPGELGVYGCPGALRRLAAALLIVADAADQLDHRGRHGEPAAA